MKLIRTHKYNINVCTDSVPLLSSVLRDKARPEYLEFWRIEDVFGYEIEENKEAILRPLANLYTWSEYLEIYCGSVQSSKETKEFFENLRSLSKEDQKQMFEKAYSSGLRRRKE